jgi:AcrR family transcriptional regulator
MIAETRGKLIAAARRAFGAVGYAEASMDDFTAEAGLTRGALYHHFGDKKGLLEAVIMQIDAEMSERLSAISGSAEDPWNGFVDECVAYVEMALEPEIQRILLLDGPAVLGDPSTWPNQSSCIASLKANLESLAAAGRIVAADPEALARLLNGAMLEASLWIPNSPEPKETSRKAVGALRAFLEGLLTGTGKSG